LYFSQYSLFGFLLVCTLIFPAVFKNNAGASTFGNHLSTGVFYTLAFSLCSGFLCMSAVELHRVVPRGWRYPALLVVISALDLLVLVSTFSRRIGAVYSEIHDDLGIALYSYDFVLSVWLLATTKSKRSTLLFTVESVGSCVALLSILKVVHLLFVGQITGAIGFGLLLIEAFPRAIPLP
jgi:hypothetical protein